MIQKHILAHGFRMQKPQKSYQTLNIIGNGFHSNVITDTLDLMNLEYKEVNLIDYTQIEDFIHSTDQNIQTDIALAIGTNFRRYSIFDYLNCNLSKMIFPNFIHPSSTISKSVQIGHGNYIGANTYIGPNSKIGNFVIINSGSIIEHDSEILDFGSIAPGCELGGNVRIGLRSAVGIGSTVLQRINISDDSLIGAKSLVNKDCPNNAVMFGIPAKLIRNREFDEEYLH